MSNREVRKAIRQHRKLKGGFFSAFAAGLFSWTGNVVAWAIILPFDSVALVSILPFAGALVATAASLATTYVRANNWLYGEFKKLYKNAAALEHVDTEALAHLRHICENASLLRLQLEADNNEVAGSNEMHAYGKAAYELTDAMAAHSQSERDRINAIKTAGGQDPIVMASATREVQAAQTELTIARLGSLTASNCQLVAIERAY